MLLLKTMLELLRIGHELNRWHTRSNRHSLRHTLERLVLQQRIAVQRARPKHGCRQPSFAKRYNDLGHEMAPAGDVHEIRLIVGHLRNLILEVLEVDINREVARLEPLPA